MAIGRLSVVVGKKGKASPHAQYIAREGKYAKHNSDLEKLEQTGSGNMPKWAAADPNLFWKMSDEHERKNGTSYREHIITLPRELTADERCELIEDWIYQEVGDKHAYQFAIHNPIAADGKEQPHAHIMFSERTIDGIERDPDSYFKRYNSKNPERGGAKKANTPMLAAERKQELKAMRERWETICNVHLVCAGSKARISMKSLKDRGIEREPINFSMSQIKNPSIKKIYIEQLAATSEFKQAMKERDTINVVDELAAIKIDEKYYEQANRAITSSKQRIDSTKRAITATADSFRIANSRTEKTADAASYITQRTSSTKQAIASSEQLAADADQAITSSKRAAAKRLEQQQQQLERIRQRPIRELLRLEFRVLVTSEHGSKLRDTVARVDDSFYDLYMQARREKFNIAISNKDRDGTLTNSELVENKTAQAIERFMMKKENLSNIDVLDDFDSNMSVQDFTRKYSLECDISDLKRLDELYPIEPKQTLKSANLSEPGPRNDKRNDNDRGFSM